MIEVALYLKRHHLQVEQVQDFTPTPGSLSTCIYHTGRDPFSGESLHVPKTVKEKRLQKALLLYHRPEVKADILVALRLCNREELAAELFGKQPPAIAARKTHRKLPTAVKSSRRPRKKS